MKEADLHKKIITALRLKFGGFFFKTHGGLYQRKGLPDIIGIVEGRFIGVEVKLPGKEDTLTEIQKITLDKITRSGGLGIMATSPQQAIDEIEKYLES